MKISLLNGLPVVSLTLTYREDSINAPNVLFDTGCGATVFDTDLLAHLGIQIDFIHGTAKRMYGIGGTGELCYEQMIPGLRVQHVSFDNFPIQLGSVQEPYGFDGILGIDFMRKAKLVVDFDTMRINFSK
ncbi:retropepsin-like aspartic protease [Cohnella thailandensis]|uniref:Retropepsin-like domain-containing protein n=1 Tax=Cohnella thailandensis TaxID=557557 RepID=A0A841T0H6_9BACL|nr:retropepsin-like aspartic protease [Cohnella thailandensis]MBB6635908.1 retropepsin-like domain-containing protein [Cohnella thailandensis]MBP1976286.1 hypothetical protein [Cohnella thailandensis]